jgi:hypothetical protein
MKNTQFAPDAYRRESLFCGNIADNAADRDDLLLKANAKSVRAAVGTKYDGVPAEDLIELAVGRCERLHFTAIKVNDLYSAIAVLEGVRRNSR